MGRIGQNALDLPRSLLGRRSVCESTRNRLRNDHDASVDQYDPTSTSVAIHESCDLGA